MEHFRDSNDYGLSPEGMHESTVKHFQDEKRSEAYKARADNWADKHTNTQLQALLNQDEEGVLMVDDLNVTEYISSQLKPLIDRIEKLEEENARLKGIAVVGDETINRDNRLPDGIYNVKELISRFNLTTVERHNVTHAKMGDTTQIEPEPYFNANMLPVRISYEATKLPDGRISIVGYTNGLR